MPGKDATEDNPQTHRQEGVHEAAALSPDKVIATEEPLKQANAAKGTDQEA